MPIQYDRSGSVHLVSLLEVSECMYSECRLRVLAFSEQIHTHDISKLGWKSVNRSSVSALTLVGPSGYDEGGRVAPRAWPCIGNLPRLEFFTLGVIWFDFWDGFAA